MEKQVLVVLLVILAALNIAAFVGVPTSFVEIGGQKFQVELADTPEERRTGLMFVEELCKECGMLFVFPEAQPLNFWMKDTLIPLDIVFISEEKNVLELHHAKPCPSEPCPLYGSNESAKYVLEVNQGILDEGAVGSEVRITI